MLTAKLESLTKSNQKKDTQICDLKSYIDYVHSKYPKVFEGEKAQYASFLASLQQANHSTSTGSLNSLNSMLSHSSSLFQQPSSLVGPNSPPDNGEQSSTNGKFKKRTSWLRSSFSRAFSRKLTQANANNQHTTAVFNSPEADLSGKNNRSCFLSDVEENGDADSVNKSINSSTFKYSLGHDLGNY